MDGRKLVERLLQYAMLHLHMEETDEVYMRNILLSMLKLNEPYGGKAEVSDIERADVPDILEKELTEYALEQGLCEESFAERFCANIFGLLSPLPSKVNSEFLRIKAEEGEQAACDYLYGLSVASGYVKKTAIAKNLKWEYQDGKNCLEITVNLSKPEKNNKDIAKLLTVPQGKKYPLCALCKENEGFEGTATHPPRRNIRTVKMKLGNEKWFMQYSPYAYYEEHCIVINEEHTPMSVSDKTPGKLLDFVDMLPNYFIGSNASLPIVGGSILNHEHFQGGLHLMPMHRAQIGKEYKSEEYPNLRIGILDWYNSAIQCEGTDRKEIESFAGKVINSWKDFDCEECNIRSHTGEVPHNTLSPICRKEGDKYLFTMILRNNRTNEEYPDGIFHVHPEYLNIKSEGIGLIEAMGLFILPPRLKRQLKEIEELVSGKVKYDKASLEEKEHDLYIHRFMVAKLMEAGVAKDEEEAHKRVENYVNRVCAGILDNTAVFKRDETGKKGFEKFMNKLQLREV